MWFSFNGFLLRLFQHSVTLYFKRLSFRHLNPAHFLVDSRLITSFISSPWIISVYSSVSQYLQFCGFPVFSSPMRFKRLFYRFVTLKAIGTQRGFSVHYLLFPTIWSFTHYLAFPTIVNCLETFGNLERIYNIVGASFESTSDNKILAEAFMVLMVIVVMVVIVAAVLVVVLMVTINSIGFLSSLIGSSICLLESDSSEWW